MRYSYNIIVSPEDLSITFELTEPLPHLAVGHRLLLSDDHIRLLTTEYLHIDRIEVGFNYVDEQLSGRYRTEIFCTRCERKA